MVLVDVGDEGLLKSALVPCSSPFRLWAAEGPGGGLRPQPPAPRRPPLAPVGSRIAIQPRTRVHTRALIHWLPRPIMSRRTRHARHPGAYSYGRPVPLLTCRTFVKRTDRGMSPRLSLVIRCRSLTLSHTCSLTAHSTRSQTFSRSFRDCVVLVVRDALRRCGWRLQYCRR